MQENYEVDNEHIKSKMKEIGTILAGELPTGWGFSLLIFNFGEGGGPGDGLFYISNARRENMIEAMKEFIAKEENK